MNTPFHGRCGIPTVIRHRNQGHHRLQVLLAITSMTVAAFIPLTAGTASAGASILIYGPSLGQEQAVAESLGYSVTVADESTWSSLTTEEFASYSAIVIGDPFCIYSDPSILTTVDANKATWSAAVTGNVEVFGSDPSYHFGVGQSVQLMKHGIAWVANGGGTGLYADLSCYYSASPAGTTVQFLSEFGSFTVQGVCLDLAQIGFKGRNHPALHGINEAGLANWACSVHEVFNSFPSPEFGSLAREETTLLPYVIATRPSG